MPKFIYVFLMVALVGCNNKNSAPQVDDSLVQKDTTLLMAKDLKTLKYTDYVLDKKAKDKLSSWTKYHEMNSIINEIKKADLSYFKGDKKVVEALAKELMETVPRIVNTNEVKARVLAVQNMYLRLNNIVNLSTSTKSDIKKGITDLLQAFSNLNFQINKKFERDSQVIIKP